MDKAGYQFGVSFTGFSSYLSRRDDNMAPGGRWFLFVAARASGEAK